MALLNINKYLNTWFRIVQMFNIFWSEILFPHNKLYPCDNSCVEITILAKCEWENFRILARWNKPSQKISIPACPMTVDKATPCLHCFNGNSNMCIYFKILQNIVRKYIYVITPLYKVSSKGYDIDIRSEVKSIRAYIIYMLDEALITESRDVWNKAVTIYTI